MTKKTNGELPQKMKMHSPDLIQRNIAALQELFPTCITENRDKNGAPCFAVDFDLLRQELSEVLVEDDHERYQLDWPGKRKALLTANAPISKTLRPCRKESVDFDTTQNLFIEGDNLEALKLLQNSYLGKVKMIYIDPPYNRGEDDLVYRDRFAVNAQEYLRESNQVDEEGNRLLTNPDSNGRFHSDWLSMMYPRLKLARNLLTEDGVIFISIGEEEVSTLKQLCNEVFGQNNFRNTFGVRRYDKNLNRQFMDSGLKSFNVGFEYILCYSRTDAFDFVPIFREASEERATTGYWKGFWNAPDRPTMRYDILGFTPTDGQWKWKKELAMEAVENYKVYQTQYAGKISLEQYWEQTGGTKKFIRRNINGKGKNQGVENWIAPSSEILRNSYMLDILASQSTDEVKGLFDFPKNVDLLQQLCRCATPGDDIILDFFAGSASTADAVMRLNVADGNNRRFIMVQLPEPCKKDSDSFAAGYETIADVGKERIRRAGKKIKDELIAKQKQTDKSLLENEGVIDPEKFDIGFRVLKVDTSNMEDVYYTPDALEQKNLANLVSNVKEGREAEDLLFQVMLDGGVELSLPVVKDTTSWKGRTVYFAQPNSQGLKATLVACFDENIDEAFVKELAKRQPRRIVFYDHCFASDAVKINVVQIFKQLSPGTDVKTI